MQPIARSPKIMVSADGSGIVSQAGGLLLTRALRATGLDCGLDVALERWRQARAVHSPGKIITDDVQEAILNLPGRIWEPAYDADGQVRPGARVAEITGLQDLANWPKGIRVIVRKERLHPGAQLRFTDIDGKSACYRPRSARYSWPGMAIRCEPLFRL